MPPNCVSHRNIYAESVAVGMDGVYEDGIGRVESTLGSVFPEERSGWIGT